MLLEDTYREKIKRILVAHQFHFAVGVTNEDISIKCDGCILSGIRSSCYFKNINFCPIEGQKTDATNMHTDKYLET